MHRNVTIVIKPNINLNFTIMVFVDKESEKSYIPVDETEHKEYASKSLAGTALGFGIGGAALWLLNGCKVWNYFKTCE